METRNQLPEVEDQITKIEVIQLTQEAQTERAKAVLPPRLLEHLLVLHRELEQERQNLLEERRVRQRLYDEGHLPQYLDDHPAHREDWKVAPIQEDLLERRVEITGPANNAKMVIQMLNGTEEARADMAMLDFEDSMKPTWTNVVDAIHNVIGVAKGTLTYHQEATEDTPSKTYRLNCSIAHPMVRVRGLHLNEEHVRVLGEPISAGLFDLVTCAFHTADLLCNRDKTPKYYVPKCESYLEARWGNKLFSLLETRLELPPGTLRVTLLIETLPAAYQMEEILYEVRSRACGLNGGRWDKIFSDIKVLKNHPDRVLADRAAIDMRTPWMDNYVRRMIKICHRRGAFAMGGMAAFTPGRTDDVREVQTEKVKSDKAREAHIGHDGCWVSHPYFVSIARNEFKKQNQLDFQLPDFPERPELLPQAIGPKTLKGLRTNVRVAILYMHGWMMGQGCVAIDNLMEDLATLEICRAQVWQWLHHRVELDEGIEVTERLVDRVFDEELSKILSSTKGEGAQYYVEAANTIRRVFLMKELPQFLSDALEMEDDQWTQQLAS